MEVPSVSANVREVAWMAITAKIAIARKISSCGILSF